MDLGIPVIFDFCEFVFAVGYNLFQLAVHVPVFDNFLRVAILSVSNLTNLCFGGWRFFETSSICL